MQSFKRRSIAEVVSELIDGGWVRTDKRKCPPFSYAHPARAKLAAIVEQLPSGKAVAKIYANW